MITSILRNLVDQKYFKIIQLSTFLGVNRKTITRWYSSELQPDSKNNLKILNLALTAGIITQDEKNKAIFDKYSLNPKELTSVETALKKLRSELSQEQYAYFRDLV